MELAERLEVEQKNGTMARKVNLILITSAAEVDHLLRAGAVVTGVLPWFYSSSFLRF